MWSEKQLFTRRLEQRRYPDLVIPASPLKSLLPSASHDPCASSSRSSSPDPRSFGLPGYDDHASFDDMSSIGEKADRSEFGDGNGDFSRNQSDFAPYSGQQLQRLRSMGYLEGQDDGGLGSVATGEVGERREVGTAY